MDQHHLVLAADRVVLLQPQRLKSKVTMSSEALSEFLIELGAFEQERKKARLGWPHG